MESDIQFCVLHFTVVEQGVSKTASVPGVFPRNQVKVGINKIPTLAREPAQYVVQREQAGGRYS